VNRSLPMLLPLLLLPGFCYGQPSGKLFFSKSFPGSTPDFVSIALGRDGKTEFRLAPDEEPLPLQLKPSETEEIFGLAEKLEWFKRPLESPLKVAFTGVKIFRYVNGAEKTEVKFNFSEDPDARLLADLFEKISESGQLYFNLERAAKYDKLGVNKAVLQIEAAFVRKRLAGATVFLPLLDRVSGNESYIHMARTRAAALADAIRAPQ
jgi:hypothetical protein